MSLDLSREVYNYYISEFRLITRSLVSLDLSPEDYNYYICEFRLITRSFI